MMACENGHKDIVMLLLEAKADVNKQNKVIVIIMPPYIGSVYVIIYNIVIADSVNIII